MATEVKVIADSISPAGIRLTTFQLKYWRGIHAELMTHRAFSRNASSSRAIPVNKMIQAVLDDPAMPVHWGKNQAGMQAREELTGEALERVKEQWLKARDAAVFHAQNMVLDGAHKQIVNRILEPWQHIHVVVTATDFNNWFGLRIHPDAQPEIAALAEAMWQAREVSAPERLQPTEWHLPYVSDQELAYVHGHLNPAAKFNLLPEDLLCRLSAARCARVSYLKHDGEPPSFDEDLALFDRLAGSQPIHASPLEHQATPDQGLVTGAYRAAPVWENPRLHGNFTGWIQFRKTLPGERITTFIHPSKKVA